MVIAAGRERRRREFSGDLGSWIREQGRAAACAGGRVEVVHVRLRGRSAASRSARVHRAG